MVTPFVVIRVACKELIKSKRIRFHWYKLNSKATSILPFYKADFTVLSTEIVETFFEASRLLSSNMMRKACVAYSFIGPIKVLLFII